jgi:hypothetical protein
LYDPGAVTASWDRSGVARAGQLEQADVRENAEEPLEERQRERHDEPDADRPADEGERGTVEIVADRLVHVADRLARQRDERSRAPRDEPRLQERGALAVRGDRVDPRPLREQRPQRHRQVPVVDHAVEDRGEGGVDHRDPAVGEERHEDRPRRERDEEDVGPRIVERGREARRDLLASQRSAWARPSIASRIDASSAWRYLTRLKWRWW